VLPVARYRFRFRMRGELILPEYADSLLRGQFGAALRGTVCMTGAKVCDGCPVLPSALFLDLVGRQCARRGSRGGQQEFTFLSVSDPADQLGPAASQAFAV